MKQVNIHLCQKMKVVILEIQENGLFKGTWKKQNSSYKNRDTKLHQTKMNLMN